MSKPLIIFCLCNVLIVAMAGDEELPPMALPSVIAATVEIPTVPLPVVLLPVVTLPAIEIVSVAVPETVIADCGVPTPQTTELLSTVTMTPQTTELLSTVTATPQTTARSDWSDWSFEHATVELPSVASPSGRLPAEAAFRAKVRRLIRDRRSIAHDPTANIDGAAFAAWLDVYDKHVDYVAKLKPLSKPIRMIAEVRLPADHDALENNLAFYANAGYTSALVTFDGSESAAELVNLACRIKAHGMRPWFAFGGAEDLAVSVYVAPAILRRQLQALARECDGMLLHWRRTSLHLLIPDRAFTDFLIRNARQVNPELQLLGEAYYGETAESGGVAAVTVNVPENASGVLLSGVGFGGVNVEGVLSKLFHTVSGRDRVALIVGERPYYATRGQNNKLFVQHLAIKVALEKRFRAAGAVGTITLNGDGSNGIYNKNHTDNLAQNGRK